MNHVDLHPEDLIDKEISGELSPEEASRLEAHVRGCDACRFERVSRDDFRAEFIAQGQRRKLAGMVANVMLAQTATDKPAVLMARPSRALRVAVMIAAALLIVGFATAAGWSVSKRAVEAPRTVEQTSREVVSHPDVPVAPVQAPVLVSPSAVPSAEPLPAPSQAPVQAKPERTAASLFAEANDARTRGDYATAITAYSEIESRHAGTPEGTATLAILGRLLLDRGDAEGALRRFDAYLKTNDAALREEAMVGRAASLEKLDRLQEAADAWSAFLDAYPSSVHAPRAKSRLAALRP